jgi:hypothetical protein
MWPPRLRRPRFRVLEIFIFTQDGLNAVVAPSIPRKNGIPVEAQADLSGSRVHDLRCGAHLRIVFFSASFNKFAVPWAEEAYDARVGGSKIETSG